MDFAEIIKRRLKELGLNVNQAELRHDLPQGFIRGVIRDDDKRAIPNIVKAKRIAEALGLELSVRPMDSPAATSTDDQKWSSAYTAIPIYDAALAAGNGYDNGQETAVGEIAFRTSWMAANGVAVQHAVAARVEGDSMAPSIHHGDLILIDRSKRVVHPRRRGPKDTRPSPIYAILDDGKARVKRIERPEANLVILQSDNPSYGPDVKTGADIEALNIIGKLVWWGHTVRD